MSHAIKNRESLSSRGKISQTKRMFKIIPIRRMKIAYIQSFLILIYSSIKTFGGCELNPQKFEIKRLYYKKFCYEANLCFIFYWLTLRILQCILHEISKD